MNEIAIRVENLGKIYKLYEKPIDRLKESLSVTKKKYHKKHYALNNISFEVKKGETLGIIGVNGSGKSTLLKIITGVLTPTTGSVIVNGKVSALLELGAGFNKEYTGIENIYLNGIMMGFSKSEIDSKIDSILDFADIGEFIHQQVKTYSSGMFARLAFAVSINVEPDILIVDEALSVGDIAFQAKCISKMKKMMNNGTTILFVTHDMGTVKSFCKECIYLDKGELKIIGPSEEIADLYLAETRDKMNRINAEIIKNTGLLGDLEVDYVNDINIPFIYDDGFDDKVKLFREGTNTAKVTAFEFTDINGNKVSSIGFNQEVILRIYLKFYEDENVTVGYHIRDDKNIELIGSSIRLDTGKTIDGKKGDEYIIEFITRIPLLEGSYNITIVVSTPTDKMGLTALFIDYIENIHVFQVERRPDNKIWDKVYIPAKHRIVKK